ncbi:MAG: YARHG domain-containing protein [Roseibacillus sp.]|nr:YARHG domain-containing protein [Roseibacillus sp.]
MTPAREPSLLPALPPLFLLVASLLPAGANDAAFGGSAANPYPIHTKEIRMVSEDITIRSDAKNGAWLYTCDFVFENLSEDPITILMGMPLLSMSEGDEDFISTHPSDEQALPAGTPMVWNFTTTVDGRSVPVTEGKPITKNIGKFPGFRTAYTWPMHFAGRSSKARSIRNTYKPGRVPGPKRRNHAIRRVRNTYKLGYNYSLGDTFLDYILVTGGLWHDGRIGRSRLRVILDDPSYVLPKKDKHRDFVSSAGTIKPAGYKVTGVDGKIVIEWDLRNFAPKEDLEVVFRSREHFIRDHAKTLKGAGPRKLRNFPYAAHGYPFKDQDLRDYFATLLYSSGNTAFKESDLSDHSREMIAEAKHQEAEAKYRAWHSLNE